jgi:hypothetical protein
VVEGFEKKTNLEHRNSKKLKTLESQIYLMLQKKTTKNKNKKPGTKKFQKPKNS